MEEELQIQKKNRNKREKRIKKKKQKKQKKNYLKKIQAMNKAVSIKLLLNQDEDKIYINILIYISPLNKNIG